MLAALALGILEGLTEFIPVSSTGHLVLLGDLIEFTGEKANTFSIFIQLAAILAVVSLYIDKFRGLLQFSSESTEHSAFRGFQGLLKLFVVSFPAGLCGLLFYDAVKSKLFAPGPVACALIVGGVVMVLIEKKPKESSVHSLHEITLPQCFGVGLFQCLSLWPGISRSGSTIIGGMILGLNRTLAAEFSFIIAVPIMCAAVGYDMLKSINILDQSDIAVFAIGFFVSYLTAVFAIRVFLRVLRKYTLAPFGYYRIVLGVVVLAFM